MKRILLVAMIGALTAAALSLCLTGCETAKGLSGLTITPSYVQMQPASNVVQFTVSSSVSTSTTTTASGNLWLPIEWSVSDSSLGSIGEFSGNHAVYRSTGKIGENTVTARDQYDNEGYATVNQLGEQYIITLAATPNPISAGSDRSTITATGGVAPFKWSVDDSGGGVMISGQGDNIAVYASYRVGDNVVNVRDANGVSGTINITQQ